MIEGANSLCKYTASKVMEILSPIQIVKFLATAAQFSSSNKKVGIAKGLAKSNNWLGMRSMGRGALVNSVCLLCV